jgi:hypothetical protein
MLYLVLFAVLAVGFYAATTISTQVVQNELRSGHALLAAETGVDFMRNALYQCEIPADVTQANLLNEVNKDLKALLNGTGNLGSNSVDLSSAADKIEVPLGSGNYIQIGGGPRFRAEVTVPSPNPDFELIVKVIGAGTGTSERAAIRLRFDREERPTQLMANGMISKGQVSVLTKYLVKGLPADHARVLTLSTVNPPIAIGTSSGTSYGGVEGELHVPQGTTPTVYPNWSVAGTTDNATIMADHVKYFDPATAPVMPVPNTSIYRTYATNTYVSGLAYYENIVIPPNTNPTINGKTVVNGVVYIQQPNKVTFSGQVDITGVIVSENSGMGTLLSNQLIFSGSGGTKRGVQDLPPDPQFDGLRDLLGSFIVAPEFDVQLTGNFGAINGHITGDKVTLSGSNSSSVTGSLVALKGTLTIGGNTDATLVYDSNQGHAGLRFPDRYVPVPITYQEVKP